MEGVETGMSDGGPQAAQGVAWIARGLEALFDDLPFRTDGNATPDDPDFDADLVIVGSGYGAAVASRPSSWAAWRKRC